MTDDASEYRPRAGEVDGILRRAAWRRRRHAGLGVAAAAVVAALVVAVPRGATGPATLAPAGGPSGTTAATATTAPSGTPTATPPPRSPNVPGPAVAPPPRAAATTPPPGPAAPAARCAAGANGGATDTGVTADRIRLFTTVVRSGTRAGALGEVPLAMRAVVDQVNAAGGICGRRLDLALRDDGGDAATGARAYREAFDDGVFAVPVGGGSGLDVLLESGELDRAGVPVVGVSAMALPPGARSRHVWQVDAGAAAAARVMVREAYARGARTFGVVFRRGNDAAARAFHAEVRRLTGTGVAGYNDAGECREHYCGGGRPSDAEVLRFYEDPPDFVGLLDAGGIEWLARGRGADDPRVPYGYAAAELDRDALPGGCGRSCHGLRVWSGLKAPMEEYDADPAIRDYAAAARDAGFRADSRANLAAYEGMRLLVAALRRAGPVLTRDALRAALASGPVPAPLTVDGSLTFGDGGGAGARVLRAYDLDAASGEWTLGPVQKDPSNAA
jgi:ABC-type branched-subunit amino acid transport system substrate-binding protein